MPDEKKAPEPQPSERKPETGADSQLRCYNAASWRLDELFDSDDDEPIEPAPEKKPEQK